MDISVSMIAGIGALAVIAGAAGAFYFAGKKQAQKEQSDADATIAKKQRDAASQPRTDVSDDRDSLLNGKF